MSRPFAKLKEEIKKEILQLSFPVGQPYVTQTNTNPSTILGFGTWERVKGRVLIGLDENDTNFNTIGKIGGEKTHKLTVNEMPRHNHPVDYAGPEVGTTAAIPGGSKTVTANHTGFIKNTGGNQPHNNLQPYQVVGYMWIRTA